MELELVRATRIMSDVKFTQAGGDETKVTFISGNHKTMPSEEKGRFYFSSILTERN